MTCHACWAATHSYTLADDLGAHLVELPYRDGRFSMLLLLPATRNALGQAERRLASHALDRHVGRMRPTQLQLHVPRFKSESGFSLKVGFLFLFLFCCCWFFLGGGGL